LQGNVFVGASHDGRLHTDVDHGASMRKARVPFFRFAMNQSILHKGYFVANPLSDEKLQYFESLAERSLDEQRAIEAADSETLDEHIAHYMAVPSTGGA